MCVHAPSPTSQRPPGCVPNPHLGRTMKKRVEDDVSNKLPSLVLLHTGVPLNTLHETQYPGAYSASPPPRSLQAIVQKKQACATRRRGDGKGATSVGRSVGSK